MPRARSGAARVRVACHDDHHRGHGDCCALRAFVAKLSFLLVGLLTLTAASPLVAHDLARSDSRLEIEGRAVRCTLTVDLLEFPGVDADGNGVVSYDELDRSIAAVFARVKEHFLLRAPGEPAKIVMTRHELIDEHTARIELAYTFPTSVSRLEVTSTIDQLSHRPDHQHFVTAMISGTRRDAVLDAGNRTAVFETRWSPRASIWLPLTGLLILGALFVYQRRVRTRRRI
jgi:hypothetical protein